MNPRLIARGIPELLPMVGRSGDPRRHVSVIIGDLCVKLGHYQPREEATRPKNLMEIGCAFEDLVATSLVSRYALDNPDRYVRPGQLEKDELLGTPDLLDMFDWAIHEIKLTNMSSRHDIESDKFWRYWVQLMEYCYMVGTRLGRLHIGFLRGDYRDIEVDYFVWECEFSIDELWENHRMLKTHSDMLIRDK